FHASARLPVRLFGVHGLLRLTSRLLSLDAMRRSPAKRKRRALGRTRREKFKRDSLLWQDANGALIGARGKGSVGLQRRGNVALALFCRLPAEAILLGTADFEFLVRNTHADLASGNVDVDDVAIATETDRAALGCFRRGMANGQA